MHDECVTKKTREVLAKLGNLAKNRQWILAGGTALALHLGHRISIDLDFFTHRSFSTESVFQEINRLGLNLKLLQEAENTLLLTCNDVKVSAFKYPYPFIEPTTLWKNVSLAGILDIAAMKVIAISQRGTKRDFVDLYMVLRDTPFRKVADLMNQKFGKDRINPMHIAKSMVYFTDADGDPDPRYRGNRYLKWPEVKKFFKKNIKQFTLDMH